MSVARYWHTIRHLKVRQVTARLLYLVRHPSPDLRPPPSVRRAAHAWQPFVWREPSLVDAASARFLNECVSIAGAAAWQNPRPSLLWLYNLHYFDDLGARDAPRRLHWHHALIARWIAENPPGKGVGWRPYPASLRIANWIKWRLSDAGNGVPPAGMIASLAVQARWLARRLEFDNLGNHLWANAKALLMSGVYFDGPEADAWRRTGLRILRAELEEQVLPDGGHFERSPMYQSTLLEDVLDLLQIARVYGDAIPADFIARLRSRATVMMRWLLVMSHPDGEISFFNDAAMGIAATHAALDSYARANGVEIDDRPLAPLEVLGESGYVRLTNARAAVFCDLAPVGPDYQPAHAHADTLSFELSVDGRRVIVNGGTSTYAPGPERLRQRGTAAHSTVEIDGRNSSDVWAAFRVARRARPFDVRTGQTHGEVWAGGAHDGYRHRPGAIHRRTWRLHPAGLTILDEVTGRYTTAVARFILHPDAVPGAGAVRFEHAPAIESRSVPAQWHPRFGQSLPTEAIEVHLDGGSVATSLQWP